MRIWIGAGNKTWWIRGTAIRRTPIPKRSINQRQWLLNTRNVLERPEFSPAVQHAMNRFHSRRAVQQGIASPIEGA
jgi:hypothetical protein